LIGNSKALCQDLRQIEKGTLIIIGIATDGIVIAADSRVTKATLIGGEIRDVNYRDCCQKIFIVAGLPMANTGLYNIGPLPLSDFVKEYNQTVSVTRGSLMEILRSFGRYFYIKNPDVGEKNTLYFAGYRNDSALIYYTKGKDAYGSNITIILSDSIADPYIKKNLPKKLNGNFSCKELEKVFEKTIQECSKLRKTIGGPVSIIRITKDNTFEWIKNDFSKNPQGEMKIHNVPIKDTSQWNNELRVWLNLHK
jgi:hypothetical protein